MRKVFYYVEFTNTSPIHIGNGDNTNSDLDVILDKKGEFYIPGSSMAGCIVHFLNDEDKKRVLPELEIQGEEKAQTMQSPVFFSDAVMLDNKTSVEKRDGIRLDENKITVKNNKYDYEVIPRGKNFRWRVEITDRDYDGSLEKIIEEAVGAIEAEEIKVGFKTTRGLGNLHIENFAKRVFDAENIEDFYSFDPCDPLNYKKINVKKPDRNNYLTIDVDLTQRGGISIRTYNTAKGVEDYEHIHSAGEPVIPGTSWNGLIRHSFEKYIKELNLPLNINRIFGTADEEKIKSSIYVHEDVIKDSEEIVQTRIRINPFTAGTVNSALYKEKSCYNGTTTLKIMIDRRLNNENVSMETILNLFRIFINDLNYGFVALGGETSIGRGLFEVTTVRIDQKDVKWVVNKEC